MSAHKKALVDVALFCSAVAGLIGYVAFCVSLGTSGHENWGLGLFFGPMFLGILACIYASSYAEHQREAILTYDKEVSDAYDKILDEHMGDDKLPSASKAKPAKKRKRSK